MSFDEACPQASGSRTAHGTTSLRAGAFEEMAPEGLIIWTLCVFVARLARWRGHRRPPLLPPVARLRHHRPPAVLHSLLLRTKNVLLRREEEPPTAAACSSCL